VAATPQILAGGCKPPLLGHRQQLDVSPRILHPRRNFMKAMLRRGLGGVAILSASQLAATR